MSQTSVSHNRNIGLTTALAGALWAVHKEGCGACGKVPKLWGHSLSRLGVGFYSVALIANLFGVNLVALLQAGAYAHGGLVVHMLLTNQLCQACLLTALGAIVAAKQIP